MTTFNEVDLNDEQDSNTNEAIQIDDADSKQEYDDMHDSAFMSSVYRPQRTKGQRVITITDTEERKGRIAKHTVYVIECDPAPTGVVTVARRYNDFKWLQLHLGRQFPGLFVPPLPPAALFGRFEDMFIEERRQDLERFLNRIEDVKCFSESLCLSMFLSRPETTLEAGKKEVVSNLTERCDQEIADELHRIFPDLEEEELPDDVHIEDIPRLSEFLMKVEVQMGILNKSATKLFRHLNNVSLEMQKFHEAFDALYTAEANYPYKTKEQRLDVRIQFSDWAVFQTKQTDCYYENFFRQLRYEHEDVRSLLDLFRSRDAVDKKYQQVCKAIDKWEEMEANGHELTKEKHILQKQRDYENRKQHKALLDIITKIILKNEIHVIWAAKTNSWRERIQIFAQMQAKVTNKMLAGWKQVQSANVEDDV